MEMKREVKTIRVDYTCSNCQIGDLINTEENLLATIPPKYSHKCNVCGHTKTLDIKYPFYEYEIINY